MDQPDIAYDCRYFVGDRPCRWHKQEGVVCKCDRYEQVQGRILIIKLDAAGDVLRTTCLLPPMARAWPGRCISWITRSSAAPLLHNNPYLDEVIPYGADALCQLAARRFEKVINLDAAKTSASLAALARADEKAGYVMNPDGFVEASNAAALEWLRMGVFDNLKKANQKTYQQRMCAILQLPEEGMDYVLELSQSELQAARQHVLRLGVDPQRRLIGIHTGGGERWQLKQWHPHRFAALIPELIEKTRGEAQILLLGGPPEGEVNRQIMQGAPAGAFDGGCENSLRHFAALVGCCDVLLSGDSLAMHVALAMKRRAVVLFGPTSHAEIDLFGRGEKVIPELDCLVCYKQQCDFVPNCMDMISLEMVSKAVLRQLKLSTAGPASKKPVSQ